MQFLKRYQSTIFLLVLLTGVIVSHRFFYGSQEGMSNQQASPTVQESARLWEKVVVKRVAEKYPTASLESEKNPSLNNVESPQPPSLSSGTPPSSSSQQKIWSDEEIFRLQHPDYYLNYLQNIEDVMAKNGFLSESERSSFTSEDQILSFFRDRVFDFMVAAHVTPEEDRSRFLESLSLVKSLHIEEARLLRGGAAVKNNDSYNVTAVISEIVSNFAGIFSPAKADAQTCFQVGAATPGLGVNLIAPCCACNVLGAPIGCLNLMCVGRPAIYDQTTFICGCG